MFHLVRNGLRPGGLKLVRNTPGKIFLAYVSDDFKTGIFFFEMNFFFGLIQHAHNNTSVKSTRTWSEREYPRTERLVIGSNVTCVSIQHADNNTRVKMNTHLVRKRIPQHGQTIVSSDVLRRCVSIQHAALEHEPAAPPPPPQVAQHLAPAVTPPDLTYKKI